MRTRLIPVTLGALSFCLPLWAQESPTMPDAEMPSVEEVAAEMRLSLPALLQILDRIDAERLTGGLRASVMLGISMPG